MPTAAANVPRTASARLRGIAAPPPPTTVNKRARPPTADSMTLASSPLHRHTNDVITVPESPQRSPTKRSRTSGTTTSATPSTPPGRNSTPNTPTTPKNITTKHTTRPLTGPLTTAVPEDVAKICGIPNGHADALTTALSIVYKTDDRVGTAVDTILQRLFYTVISQAHHAAAATPPPVTTAVPATTTNPPPTYASRVTSQTTPMSQQTNNSHSNTHTTATKPRYEE
ncbi:hypothetical protein HMPREF1624_08618, partial [Sporothrix schenckii ATCC 58251]